MSTTRYQTVRLSRGKHGSPEDGACVMELASMLAGEEFSDHPRSVCPIIAAFLRGYNDAVDEERRQDLYRYASEVVGSRAGADVIRDRTVHLTERARQLRGPRRRWPLINFLFGMNVDPSFRSDLSYAVRALSDRGDQGHADALRLVDELLAIGADPARGEAYAISVNSPTVTEIASSAM